MRNVERTDWQPEPNGDEWLQRRDCGLVERLLAGLAVGVTEAGLDWIHVVAWRHFGSRHAGRRGHRLSIMIHAQFGARVRRYSKLHEQYAEQCDGRSNEPGWTG